LQIECASIRRSKLASVAGIVTLAAKKERRRKQEEEEDDDDNI
jgi:hypothetical protein